MPRLPHLCGWADAGRFIGSLKAPDGIRSVVRCILYGLDHNIIACSGRSLHIDPVALFMSEKRFSEGGYVADPSFERILPDGSHDLIGLCLVVVFKIDLNRVIQSDLILPGGVRDDSGRLNHTLQVSNPAFILVLIPLGRIIFKVLA